MKYVYVTYILQVYVYEICILNTYCMEYVYTYIHIYVPMCNLYCVELAKKLVWIFLCNVTEKCG